jgi:L-threonylcarbamoyladenylate synthase
VRAKVLQPTAENLALAAREPPAGKLVAMPTETVYGLAGSAFDAQALASIFETKERPTFDPLIVHVAADWGSLERLEAEGLVAPSLLGPQALAHARALMRACWPGPLTLVLPKGPRVPDLATSGLPTVAIRVPDHPIAAALLKEAGIPLAAPSANRFGRISPTSAEDVAQELGSRIDWILDGGRCEIGVESTVLSIDASGLLAILRPGGTPAERIEAVTGGVAASPRKPKIGGESAAAPSPGMMLSHYAPVKPLRLLGDSVDRLGPAELSAMKELFSEKGAKSIGLLLLSGDAQAARARLSGALGLAPAQIETRSLSRSGSLAEAAQNLFATLRELDRSGAELLFSEPCRSSEGLGFAIADRLKRASAEH